MVLNNSFKNKIIFIKKFITIFLILFSFVFKNETYASTLPMGNFNNGVGRIRELLQDIRRQAMLNLPNTQGAQSIQSQFDQVIGRIDSQLGQFTREFQKIGEISNLGNQIQGGNSEQIPAIQELINNFQGFGSITNVNEALNLFNQLGSQINVPGFNEVSSIVNQGLGQLQNFAGNIGNLSGNLDNINAKVTEIASLENQLQNAWNPQLREQVQQTLTNSQIQLRSSLDQMGQNANQIISGANNVVSDQNLNEVKNEFGDVNMSQGEDSMCQGNDAGSASGEGGGGDGVPVIEQPGQLMGLTKELVNITLKIKSIDQKTCEMTKEILKIQMDLQKKDRKDDPDAAKKAREEIAKEKEAFEKRMKGERKPSNQGESGESKKSFYPTLGEFLQEESEAIRIKALQNVKDSEIPDYIKDPLLKVFEQERLLLNDPKAAYNEKVKPTPGFNPDNISSKKGNEFFSDLITLAEPRNNIVGQLLLNRSEMQKLEEKHILGAEKTWSTYQFLPEWECVEYAEYGGDKSCIKYEIITPAKWVADQGSAFATTKLRMTESTDEAGEDEGSALSKGGGSSVSGSTAELSGQSDGEVSNPAVPGGNQEGGNIFDFFSQACELLPGVCERLLGESNNQQEETVEETIPESPLPIIKFTDEGITTNPETGLRKTRISWETENASYCLAGNNWNSYGDDSGAATIPVTIINNGGDLNGTDGIEGFFDITHPSIFRYKITASPNGTFRPMPSQNPTMSLTRIAGSLVQSIRYQPNINGLIENDIILFSLNGKTISITASQNEEDITTENIISRISNYLEDQNQTSFEEFSKYEKTIDTDNITLTRRTNSFDASSDYRINCYGQDGRMESGLITIRFQP